MAYTYKDKRTSTAPYKMFNVGNSEPIRLIDFIEELENLINKKANKYYCEMQPGDVLATHSDITLLEKYIGYRPKTPLNIGLTNYVKLVFKL